MTLIELMIAMGLTLLVISTMSYFFRHVNAINRAMDNLQEESFQKRYLESRLMDIIPKAVSATDQKHDFLFFSAPDSAGLFKNRTQSILLTFDNCVNLDSNFSSHVLGRLYLDEEDRFCLAMWPSYKRWKENEIPPMKKEILLENVEELRFEFFAAPDKGKTRRKKPKIELPPNLFGEWTNEWKSQYQQLPAIVKIHLIHKVKDEEELMIFAFTLPETHQPITYDQ